MTEVMDGFHEQPACMALNEDQLLGILTLPADGVPRSVALLMLVGGPQYRAGAHRQFVHLARTVAAAGWPVLRFDVRGMGDSTGRARGFEDQDDDVRVALDTLVQTCPGVRHVLLWGLCDGASAAALYVARTADPRVGGLLLLNPWVHSDELEASVQLRHWYGQRLFQVSFWRKLLHGRVGWSSLKAWLETVRTARAAAASTDGPEPDFRQGMLRGLRLAPRSGLVLLSRLDATAQAFDLLCQRSATWAQQVRQNHLRVQWLEDADHTLTQPSHRAHVAELTLAELAGIHNL